MAPRVPTVSRSHLSGGPACAPASLAELGPMVCVHAAADPHLLSGWARACGVRVEVVLDTDGPSEALCFLDAGGEPCWRLFLLPDSDFLAWERLAAGLPVQAAPSPRWRGLCRAWKLAARPQWQACALRLHAVGDAFRRDGLAAADVTLSRLGQACAERIAARVGWRPDAPAVGPTPA